MTITGALNIKLGACPTGPAGTGKTESTKDLAKALGMFCIVFNCSEQIEYKMMTRLFTGLAQQGAWSCLDEFNRIDIEVLSVIAQQLLTIRISLLKNEIKSNFGIFITMNPGYAGRTELPDNLKILFRPVSMMIPDYKLITEIMLFSEGFDQSKSLSNKMAQLYKLSSEQLSQQKHYDFGMRAVKSVLIMAGIIKRKEPTLSEEVILICAMKDSNIPKFLKDDIPLFESIVQDLFPNVELPSQNYDELEKEIDISYNALNLQKVPNLTNKLIQLYKTIEVRFGIMIVGATASGKTTCITVLQKTLTNLALKESQELENEYESTQKEEVKTRLRKYQIVHKSTLNPKCISMGELYGEVNPYTQEWQDGLASHILRSASIEESSDQSWVVFDGPVDALWIENMNTVLDDNMMLCLANGQRIKLRPQMRMIFEVENLLVASPATVSRCGMIYMTFDDLGWKPFVISWARKTFSRNEEILQLEILEPKLIEYLISLFDERVEECLELIHKKLSQPINTVKLQLVKSLCNLMEIYIGEKFAITNFVKLEKKKRFIDHCFAYSFIWSLGVSVFESNHDRINDFLRSKFQTILFPNIDIVYGFYLDVSGQEVVFRSWNDKIPEFNYSKEIPYFNLFIHTIDTTRYCYLIQDLLLINKPVFVTGIAGNGKSIMISDLLRKIQEPQNLDTKFFVFSAQTSSYTTQLSIENKLEKKNKTLLGAKPGKRIVLFIDDINMPSQDTFGAQSTIELLRLMIDKKGFYDRKEHYWKNIENTNVISCSALPSGGRQDLTQRFTRHFHMICFPKPSNKTLFKVERLFFYYLLLFHFFFSYKNFLNKIFISYIFLKIFHSILQGFFGNFQEAVKRMSEPITQATIDIFLRISIEKLPIPSKFHYTFNLRDVSKVIQGILMVRSAVIRDTEAVTRLWIHEVSRVFHDRLINNEDKEWFKDLIVELLSRHFHSRWNKDDIFGKNSVKIFI